jgi:hypothetical protein
MVLSKENKKPPSTIQTMPRTATGQLANVRNPRRWAKVHWRLG